MVHWIYRDYDTDSSSALKHSGSLTDISGYRADKKTRTVGKGISRVHLAKNCRYYSPR